MYLISMLHLGKIYSSILMEPRLMAFRFSVAWYPIYRIPEGNFRASFLTYHSLGYFAQRCNSTDSLNENMFCIVFPVLGLQSYNAQVKYC